jgi:predicted kinase
MAKTGFASCTGCHSRESSKLIILRGNSASGKSSVAAEVRNRYGHGLAIVGQDNLRRVVLREKDRPGGANIGLIDLTARYALDHGFHVIVEGILYASHYGDMLTALTADHRGTTRLYYMHVPFEETLRRHATKPQATEYGAAEMSAWYHELDLLPGGIERVITAEATLNDAVALVMSDAGLASQQAREHRIQRQLITADHRDGPFA